MSPALSSWRLEGSPPIAPPLPPAAAVPALPAAGRRRSLLKHTATMMSSRSTRPAPIQKITVTKSLNFASVPGPGKGAAEQNYEIQRFL